MASVVNDCRGALKVDSDDTIVCSKQSAFAASYDDNGSVLRKDVTYYPALGLELCLYLPSSALAQTKKLPIFFYFHGRCYCIGSRTWGNFHNYCLRLALALNAIMVVPNYCMRPENRLRHEWLSEISDLLNSNRLIRHTFKELQDATDNFSGVHKIKGFVFHGTLRGKRVDTKQIKDHISVEMNMLRKFHHANLVTLLGLSLNEVTQHSYLVFKYTENGSLSDWIHGARSRKSLSWNQRLQISVDTAEKCYLHSPFLGLSPDVSSLP